MNAISIQTAESPARIIPDYIEDELDYYEQQIKKYRAGELGETKMQKLRLHFGTYAQRQEGVQMQRIKIPGGYLTADQLTRLADAADRYASGFIHFTTREDAQLYYLQLEEAPALLRALAEVGVTTREACGNTVRNITACYRAGVSHTEIFNVYPYAQALFRYFVRNKFNQNMGRKFKIAFEGCADDHSALAFHDLGFHAVAREENGETRRGFRVYVGGGMGGSPHVAHVYTDFLPVEELFNFSTAVIRVFDRYGERKQRMKARMKFLVQTMGWEKFRDTVDAERGIIGPLPSVADFLEEAAEPEFVAVAPRLNTLDPLTNDPEFQQWARDSVIEHRIAGLRGVHVRTKLGDITADDARALADVARRFSAGELRVSIEQNLFLPWVRSEDLPELYKASRRISLGDAGAETVADVTACPGADTCRLGIASAKGLGSAISEAFFDGPLAPYRENNRDLRIKISGCPNGCAQHAVANIGFHAAAMTQDGRNVPAHLLFLGGQANPHPNHGQPQAAKVMGKFPARNAIKVVETLFKLHHEQSEPGEDFNSFIARLSDKRVKEALEPLRTIPAFEDDPQFYEDYGHENERFTVRSGVRGECAGTTIAEVVPVFATAHEQLQQTAAYIHHGNYEQALIEAYESAAAAARVPLYQRLVDPFTSLEALWEFENLFVLSGRTDGSWNDLWNTFENLKTGEADEASARAALELAREFVGYCERLSA
ncbi:MAG: nitrite/sulfite reductase [Blastocatellia bacterium]